MRNYFLHSVLEYDDVRRWAAQWELQDANNTPLQQTDYEYDGVGNNMGGEYVVDYTYDDQYRLMDAWQYNSILGDYSYSMSYSPSGGYKNSPGLNADMVFGYRYEGDIPISHQPKMIYSPSYYEDITLLGWDTNGQMTSMLQPYQNRFRRHWWDETGQLAAAIGNEYCGYYGYNANGERAYKLTGTVLADQYDAGDVNIETYFDDIVLYVNPYMVVTPRGYTKHYYNGSQRIAARLGDYWYNTSTMGVAPEKVDLAREVLDDRLNSGNTDEEYFEEEYYYSEEVGDIRCEPYTLRTTYSSCTYAEDMLYNVFDGGTCMSDEMRGIDKGIFFYHSDHLGSASWITDDQGGVIQYIHYMPYGELWVNQRANSYDERFKFTGKERDTETGYDYFGARYYLSLLGIWLSPDPLLDEYPEISSYAYCKWNPMRYVDPNGAGPQDRVYLAKELVKLQIPYKQETNTNLRTMPTKEALSFMDCSEFVCRIMAWDGITQTVESHNTIDLLQNVMSDESKYIKSTEPMAGDIVLWEGHTGIVETYDESTKKVTVLHATSYDWIDKNGNKKSVHSTARERYKIDYYVKKGAAFYRPKEETPDFYIGTPPEIDVYPKIND